MKDPSIGHLVAVKGTSRRRRRYPFTGALLLLGGLAGMAWFWYSVFSPLFQNPRDYAALEREFRKEVREVLTGGRGTDEEGGVSLPRWPLAQTDVQKRLVACADGQVARGVQFTRGYHPIGFPWGDIPDHLGTSLDVVIRCVRAVGLDLQQMLHYDRVGHPARYPLGIWGHPPPDRSIDHRRMPNLYTFIQTFIERLDSVAQTPAHQARFLPGDIVFWSGKKRGEYPGMVGIVNDRRDDRGTPLVVALAPEERRVTDHHRLTDWKIVAHYRVEPDKVLERFLETNPTANLAPHPDHVR
jgi:uncharacterized protein YijF (DUF1287 family)